MNMKLSIIIPVYNVEEYIARCLDSIYNQNIEESQYEVIVVNDGSPDGSLDITKTYVLKHTNLTIISQENAGLSAARNAGLEKAQGEYVWFVDSDDWLTCNSISVIFGYLKESPSLIASRLIFSWGNGETKVIEPNTDKSIVSNVEYLRKFAVGAVQRYIIKRDLLIDNKLQFYKGIYHEDAEFAPRLLFSAKEICVIPESVYHYFQREGSIMSTWKLKNTKDYCFVSNRLREYSESLHSKDPLYSSILRFYSFKLLLRAFPYTKLTSMKEVSVYYDKKSYFIRKQAFRELFSKQLSMHERLIALVSFLSPKMALYLLSKK